MKMLDIVLTSLVNNEFILNCVVEDINNRFKMNVDKEKLTNYLSTYECPENKHNISIW